VAVAVEIEIQGRVHLEVWVAVACRDNLLLGLLVHLIPVAEEVLEQKIHKALITMAV
jgi:hypothetical protein